MERGNAIIVNTETLDPEQCRQLLQWNTNNRKLSRRKVEEYRRDIADGKWEVNGEAISIDLNGKLLNGQHRLTAALEANQPITTVVVRGLSPEVVHTIDTGKKRTYSDWLGMNNVPHASGVAATMKVLANLAFGQSKIRSITHSEMDHILARHPGIVESAARTNKIFPKMATSIAAGHYIIKHLGYPETTAENLLHVWKSGQATYVNDAMVFVREYLIRHQHNELRVSIDFRRRLFNTGLEKFIQGNGMMNARLNGKGLSITGWTERELGIHA
tara:strand:- start:17 stop:835 length:819 start_codon:yes stop_codon:yes gene_type:complete